MHARGCRHASGRRFLGAHHRLFAMLRCRSWRGSRCALAVSFSGSNRNANVKHVTFVLALFAASCGGQTAPTTPSSVAPLRFVVSGTVRDDRGSPLANAQVFGGIVSSKTGPFFGSTTDSAGSYRGELPAGTWEILVQRAGFEEVRSTFSLASDVVLDFTLHPGITVSGRVSEAGVGPLENATIEITSGSVAGRKTTTSALGVYVFSHIVPGDFTIRASKPGYESIERQVQGVESIFTIDFTLKWSYGTCLRSVDPVLFDLYPSVGGQERVFIDANAGRQWSVTADSPWLQVSPETHNGSAGIVFTVLRHDPPNTEYRRGALMIRCSASEGQNVWVSQVARCDVRLDAAPDSPAVFPATGGSGHLNVHTATPRCHWTMRTTTDWIRTVGVNDWLGDLDVGVFFVVAPNPSGAQRTGTVTVGETTWTVTQR